MLRTPGIVAEVRGLIERADYYTVAHGMIHRAIEELADAGTPIDIVTVAEVIVRKGLVEEIGGHAYLVELLDAAPSAANYRQYAAIVREHAQRRSYVYWLADQQTRAADQGESIGDIYQAAHTSLTELVSRAAPDQVPASWRPVAMADLQATGPLSWLWEGFIAHQGITLFSALMKVGKTTLLSHLMRAMECGQKLCGYEVSPARVLYVSEESTGQWIARRDALGLGDHVQVISRPFLRKPNMGEWNRFVRFIRGRADDDLIVFDTLSALWPVREENDAGAVQEALMPLWDLTRHAGILLVHHLKKGDGDEGTGARGSGALLGFVDTIVEMRRDDRQDMSCRRRRIKGFGRHEGTPAEIIIELAPSCDYRLIGSPKAAKRQAIQKAITPLLPTESPGMTREEILDQWPEDAKPAKADLLDALADGTDRGQWRREGAGRKGSPYTYWISAPT
jgi:hypothetical protein